MRVGVKFCGGCNPRYDRSGEFDKISSHFVSDTDEFAKDHIEKGKVLFGWAKEGVRYDVLLVICGCNNQCASTDEYIFDKKISIGETGNVPQVVRKLQEYCEEEKAAED